MTWKRFNKYFNDYCEHSSIIGCNYVAEKRSRTERVLWIVLIAIAIALSVYFILEQYEKYDENPFIVSLATRERPIYTIPFPAITICPFTKADKNKFNYTSVLNRLWDNETVSPFEMQTAQYMSLVCEDNSIDDEDTINTHLLKNETFTNHFYERLDEIETLEELVDDFNCDFMGDNVASFNCTNIFTPIILDGGICYTFNMLNREEIFRPKVYQYMHTHEVSLEPKSSWSVDDGYSEGSGKNAYPRRALQSGADNALLVMLLAKSQDNDYICNTDVGYSISVHLPSTIPQTKKDFYILPLDTNSQIILQPNLVTTSNAVKKYKIEDRQCFFSDERNLEYFVTYTQENCFLECLTNYTLNKCGCVNFFMPRENTTSICGNSNKKCLDDAENEIKVVEIDALL
ncbi:pickpocket protein 28 isoform X2 [Diabrotica virgifera virgifera]|nr:pickpocket protein 28 isoform X2 [Diabrotica virgifera virgifera]